MDLVEQFQALDADLRPLELFPLGDQRRYFCTPEGARVFAGIGVDGIHFCVLPVRGDDMLDHSPVYAVSPCAGGQYVNPVALSLPDFIGYVLALKSGAGALELVSYSKKSEFLAYVRESRASPLWGNRRAEAIKVLSQFPHTPCSYTLEELYTAVSELQQNDALYHFKYSKDYYEVTGQ